LDFLFFEGILGSLLRSFAGVFFPSRRGSGFSFRCFPLVSPRLPRCLQFCFLLRLPVNSSCTFPSEPFSPGEPIWFSFLRWAFLGLLALYFPLFLSFSPSVFFLRKSSELSSLCLPPLVFPASTLVNLLFFFFLRKPFGGRASPLVLVEFLC